MARTYVVTGAASGIGRATVEALERLGHRTVTVDRHGADIDIDADLATADGRRHMVETVAKVTGVVDAVIASAGTVNRGRTDVKVNFFGAVATLDIWGSASADQRRSNTASVENASSARCATAARGARTAGRSS
jgi:NAD(P)-dependent dehydrogenase (short-subunit alcohol dehydrogenase family)